jgi:hypothetical protein
MDDEVLVDGDLVVLGLGAAGEDDGVLQVVFSVEPRLARKSSCASWILTRSSM